MTAEEAIAKQRAAMEKGAWISQQQVRDLLRQKEENHHLRQALAQSQEQCRHLEIENYSLRVHLRQMNNSGTPLGGDHRPNRDIF